MTDRQDAITLGEREFVPARLRLARELKGWNQAQVASKLGVTAAALSQFESGATRPSAETQDGLSQLLDVPPNFFMLPLVETHDGFFRSLRRTAVTDRRRARAIAHIAHDLATLNHSHDHLPLVTVPRISVENLEDDGGQIDGIAEEVRRQWGIPAGPAPNMVELLESRGVIVIRLPLGSADVDAFSLPFPDHPVLVLGSDKGDYARSRFDAAHELGHLVMHGEQVWGMPEVEKQAHNFAAAFLMPKKDIANELPTHAEWPRLFELKKKWRVSIAALMMRAKNLGKMTEASYLTAIKAASARGWRRTEPVPLGDPEQPMCLARVLASPDGRHASKDLPSWVVSQLSVANAASTP